MKPGFARRLWCNAAAPSLALLIVAGCSAPPPLAPVYSSGGKLVDPQGRSVVLRGVNIRAAAIFDDYKGYLPLPPFAEEDCRVIGDDFGLNSLRLPVSWSNYEQSRGNFTSDYTDKILQIAADCAQYGVYTLVDLHQDGWSKFLGADGAPFWAHSPALPPEDMDESAGGQSTTGAAVQAAFNGFFADETLMQSYAQMASQLALTINNQPGIVGIELMNEPLATPMQLDALYSLVAPAVRAAAPGLPIYFEPNAIRNLVDSADPDPLPVENAVYSPHLYTGVFQGNWMIGQTSRIDNSITNMLSEATQAKAALMVTEFGNNPVDPVGAAWLGDALDLLDEHVVSASLWVYEEWPSTCGNPVCWGLYDEAPMAAAGGTTYARTLRPAAVTLIARAYPRAIAGSIDSFTYDAPSRTLTVQLQGAAGTHLLSAPTLVYPGAVAVTCDGSPVPATQQGSTVSVPCAGQTLVMSPAQ
jgi:endoglycosylceramidase